MDGFWIQGVVKNGQVVLDAPLDLPDGTVVTVKDYDPEEEPRPIEPTTDLTDEFIQSLAGMWADRQDVGDPEAAVRKMRGRRE